MKFRQERIHPTQGGFTLNRVSSIFSQILQLVPRHLFERAVRDHKGERHARGFTCWDQFVAMLFCQLAQSKSLREISEGLRASEGKLKHLGLSGAPSHSTLAYANQHRPWQIYETLFESLLEHLRRALPGAAQAPRLKLPGKLLSLDSTVIDLCASVFDWAHYTTAKGAVKLHLLLDHDGLLPHYAVLTDGKRSDIAVARTLRLPARSLLVFDRGYTDYAWFAQLDDDGVWFVTRLKQGAAYDFISANERTDERVHADDLIQFRQHDKPGQERFFRRVVWWDAERKRSFEFLTNQLTLDAATIAAIYRERWQIELLFKALKQNLRIKTFVGTSSNALHIQIWTALIALLLVRFLQLRSRVNRHLSRFLALLRQQLFVYRDLGRFLHDPFERPPRPPLDEPQLLLDWSGEHSVQNPQPASGIDRSETASPAESTRVLAEIS